MVYPSAEISTHFISPSFYIRPTSIEVIGSKSPSISKTLSLLFSLAAKMYLPLGLTAIE
jgi:hypothetical protein